MSAVHRLRAFGGMLAAVVLFELVLQHLFFGIQTWKPGAGWGYYGTELRRYYFEGGSTSHWDDRGVRVIPGPAPRGAPILAVGNSVTQATQVADDQPFTARLQHEIGLPVLNVGHDAQSLAEDVYAAPRNLGEFHPAWTIIEFIPLDFENTPARPGRPYFERVDGRLEVEVPAVRSGRFSWLTQPLRRHSALFNLGVQRYLVLRDTPMPPLFRAADARPEREPGYGPVELELDRLREAYGGRVTMFLVPDFLLPPTEMERRFDAWCLSKRVSCVNLREVFAGFRRRGRAPTGFSNSNFGYGHLNREGHAAAAHLLAAEIERLRTRGLF